MASKAKRSEENNMKSVLDIKKYHKDLERDVLIKNLKELSVMLTDFQPADQKKHSLTDISGALISPALFHHKSKEVRLFIACCLADVLRVYAPNPPYSSPQLKSIFELFFDQLKGISNPASPHFPSFLYLLENFSLVNTPLILVELDNDEMLVKMFKLFFDLTQKDLAPRITSYLQTILHSCLNECENISLRLLFTILIHIVPPFREENKAGYELAMYLIRRCDHVLDRSIAGYIRDVVIDHRTPEEVEEDGLKSPLLDDDNTQLEVVYELCAQNSALMIPLHPDLQDLMETEELEARLRWVDVFGRVFTADETGLAIKFPQILLSFLKRFNDVDVNVRIKMAEFGHMLLVKHEAHRDTICEYLQARSLDKDDRVRKAVCVSVCGAARDRPTAVSLNLLNAIGRRTMDKKVPVRKEAIEGMAQLFRVHCAEFWKNGEALPKVAKKFSWIPRKLILSLHLDTTMRMLVEKVLDEDMLDVHYTVQERTRCLVGIFASLEPRSKKVFLSLLQSRKYTQLVVNDLLDIQAEMKKTEHTESLVKKRAIRILELCKQFSEGEDDKTPKKMSDLFSSKDKNIHKWLRTLASPSSDYASLRLAQEELVRIVSASVVDKKNYRKKESLAWHLSIRVAMTLLPCDSIPFIFKQAQENVANNRVILALAGLELATALAEDFPSMLTQAGAVELLIPLAQTSHEEVSRAALKVMSLCPSGGVSKSVTAAAISMARDRVFSGSGAQAKYAARIVCNLTSSDNGTNSKTITSMLKDSLKTLVINKKEEDNNINIECGFACIGEISKVFPSLVSDGYEKINKFLTAELLYASRNNVEEEDEEEDEKKKKRKSKTNTGSGSTKKGRKAKNNDNEADGEEEEEDGEETEDDGEEKKVKGNGGKEGGGGDEKLAAKIAGLKCVVKFLLASAREAKDEEDGKANVRTLAAPFTRSLLSIITKQGNMTGETSDDEELKEKEEKEFGVLVLTAAKSILKLCSNPIFERQFAAVPLPSMSPAKKIKTFEPFLQLALVAHHEQLEVRQRFIDYLAEKISFRRLPFSYTCILALCASHEHAESKKIQGLLTRLISRQRQQWQMQQSLAGAEEKSRFNQHLPELVLSNLIYLLSYHPDFDDEIGEEKGKRTGDEGEEEERGVKEDQKRVYEYFMEFPRFFLECLFSGKGAHDNNYTLISDILEVIRNSEDIRNPGNVKIYKLAELTRASLRDLYQGKDFSGSKHPGKIILPPNLYAPRSSKPKLKYLPSWYSFKKTALPSSTATTATAAAITENGDEEESVTEKKEKPATSARKKRRSLANDAPTTPTRARLPRHAKDTAHRTLEYNSDDDAELDKLADDAAVPEDIPSAEDSDEDKPKKKLRRNSENGNRTPAKGKTSKKSQPAEEKKEEVEGGGEDEEEEKHQTKGKTSRKSRGQEEEEEEEPQTKGKTSRKGRAKEQEEEEEKHQTKSGSRKGRAKADEEEEGGEEEEEEEEQVGKRGNKKGSSKSSKQAGKQQQKDEEEEEDEEEKAPPPRSSKKGSNKKKTTAVEEDEGRGSSKSKGAKSDAEGEGEDEVKENKKGNKRGKSKSSKSEDEEEEVKESENTSKKGSRRKSTEEKVTATSTKSSKKGSRKSQSAKSDAEEEGEEEDNAKAQKTPPTRKSKRVAAEEQEEEVSEQKSRKGKTPKKEETAKGDDTEEPASDAEKKTFKARHRR